MANWTTYDGGSLPQYPDASGYSEQPGNGKIETEMETGPVVMRSLYTSVPTVYSVRLTMTSDQVDTLLAFYYTECSNGVSQFTWVHPRTHASADMRFLGSPPKIAVKAYNAYTVSFTVEIT